MTPELWKRVCGELDRLETMPPNLRADEMDRLRATDSDLAAEVQSLMQPKSAVDLELVLSRAWQSIPTGDMPVDPDAFPPEVPGCTLDPGEENIRYGGMGVVYFGTERELRRPVAVKVLRHALAPDPLLATRFREETLIAAQLQHPGIVPVYAVGQLADGRPFCMMKRIRGETFTEVLKRRPTPATDLIPNLSIFRRVCDAVGYAHGKRIIHRDLKPSNVMVGAYGEVLLVDWGLAKKLDNTAADPRSEPYSRAVLVDVRAGDYETKSGLGSTPYLAPEQAQGQTESVDERSDVFGLGAILCVILTGQPPYIGPSEGAVERRALRGDLEETFERLENCGADPELIELARRCLARDRQERPADGGAVAGMVTAYIAGVEERLRRTEIEQAEARVRAVEERKRRRIQVALAVAGVVTVLGLAVGTVLLERKNERLAQALQAVSDQERKTQVALIAVKSEQEQTRAALDELQAEKRNTSTSQIAIVMEFTEAIAANNSEFDILTKTLMNRFVAQARQNFTPVVTVTPESLQLQVQEYYTVAVAERKLKKFKEAETDFRHAMIAARKLVKRWPNVAENECVLARVHNGLGWLYRDMQRPDLALEQHRAALDLLERLVKRFPLLIVPCRDLATTHNHLAVTHSALKNWDAAVQDQRNACQHWRLLWKRYPSSVQYGRELASSYESLIKCFKNRPQSTNFREDIRKAYCDACEVRHQLVQQYPDEPGYAQLEGFLWHDFSVWLSDIGENDASVKSYETARAIRESLVAKYEAVADYHHDLAATLTCQAIVRSWRGEHEAAFDLLVHAETHHRRALKAEPKNAEYRRLFHLNRYHLVNRLLALGRHSGVLPAAQEWVQYSLNKRQDGYEAACAVVAAIELIEKDVALSPELRAETVQRHIEEAIGHLREAVKQGWRDHWSIKKDARLARLSGCEDFGRLVAEVEHKFPAREPAPLPRLDKP